MSVSDEPRPQADDELADWLAACDDLLARGSGRVDRHESRAQESQQRILRDLECVQLLRKLWPRSNADASSDHNGLGDAASEAELPQHIGRFEIHRAWVRVAMESYFSRSTPARTRSRAQDPSRRSPRHSRAADAFSIRGSNRRRPRSSEHRAGIRCRRSRSGLLHRLGILPRCDARGMVAQARPTRAI